MAHPVVTPLADKFMENVPAFVLGFLATGIGGALAFHSNFVRLETKFEDQKIHTEQSLHRIESTQDKQSTKMDEMYRVLLQNGGHK